MTNRYGYRVGALVGGAASSAGLCLGFFATDIGFLFFSYGTLIGMVMPFLLLLLLFLFVFFLLFFFQIYLGLKWIEVSFSESINNSGIFTAVAILTLKAPITTAADDSQKYFFFIFQRKQVLAFHVNRLPADDSHEMSRLVFSEK